MSYRRGRNRASGIDRVELNITQNCNLSPVVLHESVLFGAIEFFGLDFPYKEDPLNANTRDRIFAAVQGRYE